MKWIINEEYAVIVILLKTWYLELQNRLFLLSVKWKETPCFFYYLTFRIYSWLPTHLTFQCSKCHNLQSSACKDWDKFASYFIYIHIHIYLCIYMYIECLQCSKKKEKKLQTLFVCGEDISCMLDSSSLLPTNNIVFFL